VSQVAGSTSPAVPDQAEADETTRSAVREGVTMALYVAISLLAVLIGLPAGTLTEPVREIFFTALGLLMAHTIAFQLSARFTRQGQLIADHARRLGAQLVGGLSVTALAIVPVYLSPDAMGVALAELLLLGLVALTGYAAARSIPISRIRAVAYVVGVVVATLAVLWVKLLVGH
jgi:hypothetical protein